MLAIWYFAALTKFGHNSLVIWNLKKSSFVWFLILQNFFRQTLSRNLTNRRVNLITENISKSTYRCFSKSNQDWEILYVYPPGTKYQVPWRKPEGIRSTHVPNISKPRGRGLQQGFTVFSFFLSAQILRQILLQSSTLLQCDVKYFQLSCYCKCGLQYFSNHHNCYKFEIKYVVKYQE